jgi:hypothetical protein
MLRLVPVKSVPTLRSSVRLQFVKRSSQKRWPSRNGTFPVKIIATTSRCSTDKGN